MKKVIFIGGTSYSGSTFLDMVLSNDPQGFSCGEVHALFHPYRQHHFNPLCGCGDKNCNLWNDLKEIGENNFYLKIFEKFPDVNFIVDSSKNPLWIKQRSKFLSSKGIDVKNVLIWKNPANLIQSFIKRNRRKDFEKSFINYHKLYFSLIDEFYIANLESFILDQFILKDLCEFLDIEYFDAKIRYWEKIHHTLFGNTTAKIHLFNKGSNRYNEELKFNTREDKEFESHFREIYKNTTNQTNQELGALYNIKNESKIILTNELLLSNTNKIYISRNNTLTFFYYKMKHFSKFKLKQLLE